MSSTNPLLPTEPAQRLVVKVALAAAAVAVVAAIAVDQRSVAPAPGPATMAPTAAEAAAPTSLGAVTAAIAPLDPIDILDNMAQAPVGTRHAPLSETAASTLPEASPPASTPVALSALRQR